MTDAQLFRWDVFVVQVVHFERERLSRNSAPISDAEVTTDDVEYSLQLSKARTSTYRRPWVPPVAWERRRVYNNVDTTVNVVGGYVVFKLVQALTYQRIVTRLPRRSKQVTHTNGFIYDSNVYINTDILWHKATVSSHQREKLREQFDLQYAQCMTALQAMAATNNT